MPRKRQNLKKKKARVTSDTTFAIISPLRHFVIFRIREFVPVKIFYLVRYVKLRTSKKGLAKCIKISFFAVFVVQVQFTHTLIVISVFLTLS